MDRFRTMPIARSSVLIAKIVVELGRMLVATLILLVVGFLVGFDIHELGLELLAGDRPVRRCSAPSHHVDLHPARADA